MTLSNLYSPHPFAASIDRELRMTSTTPVHQTVSDTETAPATRSSLSLAQGLVVGMTLFSMFFGAGNLILPPLLGAQAGTDSVAATAGFLVAGIGLPVMGVIATALAGNLTKLGGRVHPAFASVFVILIYLSIGPCLAIPRTSSTSFEMLVPLLPDQAPLEIVRAAFSVAFFVVATVLAMKPGKISRLLGRITGPALIILIVLVVGAALFTPRPDATPAVAPYDSAAGVQGFLTGYQTMDLLASLTFGIVIAQNIRTMGVTSTGGVTREIAKAGLFMGVLMALVYCGLAFVGVAMGPDMPGVTNGAAVLTASANAHFGLVGTIIVAAIFLLACLNVCTGLISCCASYFAETFSRVPYAAWAIGFAAFSCLVSNLGLDAILAFSMPLLGALYPPAIVLVLMGMAHRLFDRFRLSWPLAVGAATVVSVINALRDAFAPGLWTPLDALPLADIGMAWVIPTVVFLVIGMLLSRGKPVSAKPESEE